MTVELRPMGVACNIQCQYCYQNPQRDAGNVARTYDLALMKAGIEAEGGPFSLFGGEPLLVPKDDLEELWRWGLERYGSNGIQTNGTLIDDDHIRMFRDYKVGVGLSIDGPGPLNDARWVGTLERTRSHTERSLAALDRLLDNGISCSVICTLHRLNASAERLPQLHDWFRELDRKGVQSARLHALEVDDDAVGAAYALTPRESLAAFRSFRLIEAELTSLKLDVFADVRNLLAGDDTGATCVWNACDPYTTAAVRGVEGHGQSSNCGRTNKDGIDMVKSDRPGYERYLALYHTPQEVGGCRGCRFFLGCKGQCPGTAIDGDWRNRTADCELWKSVFRDLEEEALDRGELPLSARPDRSLIEAEMLSIWAAGTHVNLTVAIERVEARHRGEEVPAVVGAAAAAHGDRPHGDSGHGDSAHGDR